MWHLSTYLKALSSKEVELYYLLMEYWWLGSHTANTLCLRSKHLLGSRKSPPFCSSWCSQILPVAPCLQNNGAKWARSCRLWSLIWTKETSHCLTHTTGPCCLHCLCWSARAAQPEALSWCCCRCCWLDCLLPRSLGGRRLEDPCMQMHGFSVYAFCGKVTISCT